MTVELAFENLYFVVSFALNNFQRHDLDSQLTTKSVLIYYSKRPLS